MNEEQADALLAKSTRVVAIARIGAFVALPFVVLLSRSSSGSRSRAVV